MTEDPPQNGRREPQHDSLQKYSGGDYWVNIPRTGIYYIMDMYTCVCVSVHMCVHACICACVCVCVCVCVHAHAYVWVCVYMYMYMYAVCTS